MLVTGSVIIGRREEGKEDAHSRTPGAEPIVGNSVVDLDYTDEPDAPPPHVRSLDPRASGEAAYEESSDIELMDPSGKAAGESANR